MCWFIEVKVALKAPVHAWRPPKTMPVAAYGPFPVYTLSERGSCACQLVLDEGRQLAADVLDALEILLRDAAVAGLDLNWYWSDPPRRRRQSETIEIAALRERSSAQTLADGLIYHLDAKQTIEETHDD